VNEADMADRGKQRAESARDHDDSELIDAMDEAPTQGGRSGGRMARDVGTQDEIEHDVEGQSVTRIRAEDKKEGAELPRNNQR
jgi:hypothetical protein